MPHPVKGARNAAFRIAASLSGVEVIRQELEGVSAQVSSVEVIRQELEAVAAQVEQLSAVVGELGDNIERLASRAENRAENYRQELHGRLNHDHREAVEILQLLRDDEPETRRRLWALRETEAYAQAFEEAEPLVTVVIPTYTNTESLIERSLPAVLAQTYQRLEVIVVGDGAGPDVAQAVKGVGDTRIRYVNLTHRGPYPDDPKLRWLVAGGPATNEGMRLAAGRWIAPMDDDDACTPDYVDLLLKAAQEQRLEFCYGRIREHLPDGTVKPLCEFPPRLGAVSLTCSIIHSGMSFIVGELGDALFGLPGDWSRIRRMMRVGVRMGMIDEFVLDYYPGKQWNQA